MDNTRLGGDLISFSDCPHGCKNGKIYNPYTGVSIDCPHCTDKRIGMATGKIKDDTGKELHEYLKVPKSLWGIDFNKDKILPPAVQKYLTADSVSEVFSELDSLKAKLSVGEVPTYSMMFNLGREVNLAPLVYPLLMQSYIGGLLTAPLLTSSDLCALKVRYQSEPKPTNLQWGDWYSDYVDADTCVVSVDSGLTDLAQGMVKSLLYNRALKDKATILVTNSWGRVIKPLEATDGEEVKYLAKVISVKYITEASSGNTGIV